MKTTDGNRLNGRGPNPCAVLKAPASTHAGSFDFEELAEFLDLVGEVADSDGAMVGGAVRVPVGDEASGTDGETVAAVGVADLEDRAGRALALGDKQLEAAVSGLNYREQCDRAIADSHFHTQPAADLAVIDPQL